MSVLLQLKNLLTDDEVYRKYSDITRVMEKRVDVNQILTEAKLLHAQRSARSLVGTRPTNEKLYEAVAKDLAVRGRLVELRMTLNVEIDNLSTTLATVTAHTMLKCDDVLSAYKTVDARKTAMRKVTRRGSELLEKLKSADDQLSTIVKDIDQASFSLSHMVTLFKILHERRDPTG